jgi:hypothetical protein
MTVSIKNHIGYSNTDVYCVQFDGNKVHGVIWIAEMASRLLDTRDRRIRGRYRK